MSEEMIDPDVARILEGQSYERMMNPTWIEKHALGIVAGMLLAFWLLLIGFTVLIVRVFGHG